MKKLTVPGISALVLVLITLSFTGCEKLESADDISFDAEFSVTFEIDENADLTNVAYSDVLILDATTNSDVAKYAAKIKEIKINKITYKITNYTSDPPGTAVMFSNGELAFGKVGESPTVVATVATLNLLTASGGSEIELDVEASELNSIANELLNTLEVDVHTEGTLSETPVSFNVPVTFYVTITANAL